MVSVAAGSRKPPVVITVYVCVGMLQHANLGWNFGPLGKMLVSPAYLRLHHASDVQHRNRGAVLTIWDVLARRARFAAGSAPAGVPAWTAARSRSSRTAHPGGRPGRCWRGS